jgi:DNA-binding response OmpR family regulator
MTQQTILVIEDELELLGTIQLLLELNNFTVLPAENAGDGIKILKNRHVDLVLSDISLPDDTGYSVLQFARNSVATADIPVILMTAFADEHTSSAALSGGADDFFTKPFSSQELLQSISSKLAHSDPKSGKRRKRATGAPNGASGLAAPPDETAKLFHEVLSRLDAGDTPEEASMKEALLQLSRSVYTLFKATKNLLVYRAVVQHNGLPAPSRGGHAFLGDILAEVVDNHFALGGIHAVDYNIDFVPLPVGNAELYRFLFSELIDNAVRYNDLPEVLPSVRLANIGDGFEFSVTNSTPSGFSITPADAIATLHPGKRLGTSAIGLGLYNCVHLCRIMHLTIYSESGDDFIRFVVTNATP